MAKTKTRDTLFADYLNNGDIVGDLLSDMLDAGLPPETAELYAKMLEKLASGKSYKNIMEILSDIADDEFNSLADKKLATYDIETINEIKRLAVNKMAYYFIGDIESGKIYEKLETLTTFLNVDPPKQYIWQIEKGACKTCIELSKQVYTLDTLPEKPHPNCKCRVYGVSDILAENPNYTAIHFERDEETGEWSAFLDGAQLILDLAGLIPVYGEIADLANAVIYIARGDVVNAIWSGLAIIPVAGWFATGGKIGSKIGSGIAKIGAKIGDVPGLGKLGDKIKDAIKGGGKVLDVVDDVPKIADDVVEGVGKGLKRNIVHTSELDTDMLKGLKNEGTISVGGRSGGNRPLTGTPNSYLTTDAGHKLVYDADGRLIYDITSDRVKMTVWDETPNGKLFPRDIKLEGAVPSEFLSN